MTNWFFNKVASFIAARTWLIVQLLNYGSNRPYSHLLHSDGERYMNRYWLMPRCLLTLDETGHLFPKAWVPIKIRLHHIHTADVERDLHDHPGDYRTLLIAGFYVEEDIVGTKRFFKQGQSRAARAETFHRIAYVSKGGVWTIFIMGNKRLSWGFLVGGHKVPWREYLGVNK